MAVARLTPMREEALGNQRALYFPDPGDPPLRAGQEIPGHVHDFDHVTAVLFGGIRLEKLDVKDTPERRGVVLASRELRACAPGGNPRNALHGIEKGVPHRLTVLVEGTVYVCLYASRHPDGTLSEDWTGWPGEIGTHD